MKATFGVPTTRLSRPGEADHWPVSATVLGWGGLCLLWLVAAILLGGLIRNRIGMGDSLIEEGRIRKACADWSRRECMPGPGREATIP